MSTADEGFPEITGGREEARRILGEYGLAEERPKGPYDSATGSHVIWGMGSIRRAAEYEDGSLQTNADHIGRMVGLAAMIIPTSGRDDLSLERVITLCPTHELDEFFIGDTPHHDAEANATKQIRAAIGKILVEELVEDNQPLLNAHHEYHEQITPNARFTKALDVHETVDFAIRTRATTQRKHKDEFKEFAKSKLSDTLRDHTVHEHTKYLVRQIGRKWIAWGCQPFEGNSDEIIDEIEGEIFDELKHQAEA